MNNDTRFFDRKAHLIDFKSFIRIIQRILDDESLEFEDYPVLSLYSLWHDRRYNEEEIMEYIGGYLDVTIVACLVYMDLEVIYFIEDK